VSFENAKVESGKDSVILNGRVYPSLELKGNIYGVSMDSIKQYFAVPFKLAGRITGGFELTGDYKDPLFNLNFSGQNLVISGHPVSEVSGQVSVQDRVLRISNVLAKFSDSEFRVLKDGVVDLKSSTFNLQSNMRNVHIGPVDIFGNLSLSGSWSVDQSSNPVFNVAVNTDDIFLNQYHLEKTGMNIKYKDRVIAFLPTTGQELQLSGYVDLNPSPNVRFQKLLIKYAGESSLLLDGQIGKQNWDFTVSGKAVSASVVSEILDLPVGLEGSTDMTLVGSGDLEKPRFEGSLNIADGSVSEIPFDNFNLQFSVRQDVLTVIRARIIRKGQYSEVANGFSPFYLTQSAKKRVEKNPIDLTLGIEEGTLNLLAGFSKDIKSASGVIHAQMHATGTLASPITNGYLRVTDGELDSNKFFSKLSKLNVDCVWKNSVLSINDFSGRMGNGTMRLNGSVVFDGLEPDSYNLVWQTVGKNGINISVPQLPIPSAIIRSEGIFSNLSQGEPRFQLKLTGKADNPRLSGWVELENTNFTYPSVLKKSGEENALDSFWPKVSWDVELRTGKNTWYENQLIRANAKGSIKLSGKGASPTADGKIESANGEVDYFGTQMTIKRAVFEVVRDKCYIEGEAEGQGFGTTSTSSNMELDTITMYIDKADISAIKPRFVSKNSPGLSSAKAFQRLTGTDPDVYSLSDRDLILRQGVLRVVDSTLAAPLANLISRRAGLRVGTELQQFQEPTKPAIPGSPTIPELLQGTRVTVRKNITPEMSLQYGMLFDQVQQNNINNTDRLNLIHSFEVQYQFENNFLLKGQWGLENSSSLYAPDRRIMFEKVWRFGQ
jgi:translocation and assembly module TamB